MTARPGAQDIVDVLVEACGHAHYAREDLAHLADWAGEQDCDAVLHLEHAVEAIERALALVSGRPPAELRRIMRGHLPC